jgi:hypothetical protein
VRATGSGAGFIYVARVPTSEYNALNIQDFNDNGFVNYGRYNAAVNFYRNRTPGFGPSDGFDIAVSPLATFNKQTGSWQRIRDLTAPDQYTFKSTVTFSELQPVAIAPVL